MATTPDNDNSKKRKPHTPDEVATYTKLFEDSGKKYIRIDPKTKAEFAEAKEFFWQITSIIPEMIGYSEHEIRVNFIAQKYWRDPVKMYKATEMVNGSSRDIKRYRAYTEINASNGEMVAPGDRLIDASDFVEQYKAE